MSPCKTPARISKNSVSPSGYRTLAFVPVYNNPIAETNCSGTPYTLKTFNILPLCMLSKAFLKSMKTSVAFKFRSLTPSRSLLRISGPFQNH